MSPFAYCHGNPVKLTDPNGMTDGDPNNKSQENSQSLSEQKTGFGSYNNLAGSAFGGVSAEPSGKVFSEKDVKTATTAKENAKSGNGFTASECLKGKMS